MRSSSRHIHHEIRCAARSGLRSTGIVVCLIVSVLLTVVARAEDFGVARRNPTFPAVSSYVQPVLTTPSYQYAQPQTVTAPPPATASAAAAPKTGSQVSSASTLAEWAPPVQTQTQPLPSVVRLIAFDSTGQSFGSGAYIGNYGDYGLILSNWHVVCEADGLVHMHFANGFSTYGAVLAADKIWDLALIAISRPPQSVPLLPVARTLPKPGDPLWIAGYGAGTYRLAGGRCVRYLAPEIPPDGSTPLFEIIELSVSARQGDSGGPILNDRQELAGVLFGSDMVRNTAGSGCERVNRFLSQAYPMLATLPPKPETYFHSIEKDGPKRSLQESRTVVAPPPKVQAPGWRPADFSGSSSQFGVRSGSRRYVHPTASETPPARPQPVQSQPVRQPVDEKKSSGRISIPRERQENRAASVRTAGWENKVTVAKTNIRQTGHHIVLDRDPERVPSIASENISENLVPLSSRANRKTVADRDHRGVVAVSERNGTLPRGVLFAGSFCTMFLVGLAVVLLRNERDRVRLRRCG